MVYRSAYDARETSFFKPSRGLIEEFSIAASAKPRSFAIEAIIQVRSKLFLRDLDRNLPTALKPIFKTNIERAIYQIGGVEVCLDKGEIIAGCRSSPITEIELELKSGNRKELFALARRISAIVPAEISVKSKSDRGYDLVEGIKAPAIMAQEPALPRSSSVAEAFQIICGECLHHLISNRPGVRAHIAESLHQARVALRRLDASVKLFRKIQSEKATKLAVELKWIGDELADARELDVLMIEFLVPLSSEQPTDSSLAKIHGICAQWRENAYERANAALNSQRFRMFLIDVAEWIETGNGQRATNSRVKGEPSAKDLVSKALSKMLRKMKAIGRIDDLDLRSLHKLRLHAKRMRYIIEFDRSLNGVSDKGIDGILKQLGKLQSALREVDRHSVRQNDIEPNCCESKSRPKGCKAVHHFRIDSHIWKSRTAEIQTIQEGCQSV